MSKGGAREGAGRPKAKAGQRPQHQVRAYDDEWEVIKVFSKIVKEDLARAKRIIETK